MEKSIRKSFSRSGFVALVVVIIQIGVNAVLMPFLFPSINPSTGNPFLVVIVPLLFGYAISIPLSYLIVGKAKEHEKMPIKHDIPTGKIFAWFMVFFALSRIALLITTIIQALIVGDGFTDPVVELQLSSPWMMFVLATFIAPVVEELIFRGLFYKALAPYGGKWYILISGLFFGLFHLNFTQIPFAFILGLFFAYVMYRTGNILIPILLHFITNLFSSINMLFVSSKIGLLVVSSLVFALIIAGLIVGIVLAVKGRIKEDIIFEPASEETAKAKQVFINTGILLSIPVMIILTFLLYLMQE